jgi:4-amino-4-deoxy-L-arabinose transferase-like glycosyltransferase
MLTWLLLVAGTVFWAGFLARGLEWREAFLLATTIWAAVLVGFTEGLGHYHLLTPSAVGTAWWSALALAGAWAWWEWRRRKGAEKVERGRLPAGGWVIVACIVLIAAALALLGLWSAPTTYDSMTYHMPRVMHWMQERSVDAFPTHITRQVQQGPLMEFIMLHLMLLGEGDTLASMAQWGSMLGSVVAVSYIAKLLGARPLGQAFAAGICCAIPMGILQATSTQSDYQCGFRVLVAVALGWKLTRHTGEDERWIWLIGTGLALGLALLSKATAYTFLFPFGLLFAAALLVRWRWRAIGYGAVMAGMALPVNAGHFHRNYALSGSPLGPEVEEWEKVYPYTNDHYSADAAYQNGIRNLAVELQTPWRETNRLLTKDARELMVWLGMNPDAPGLGWVDQRFGVSDTWNHEDTAGNPLHVLLTAAALLSVPFLRERKRRREVMVYAVGVMVAFLSFGAILRWQVWHCRLLLPWALLASPLIGVVMDRVWNRYVATVVMAAALQLAIPYVINNRSRPMFREPWFGDEQPGRKTVFETPRTMQRMYGNVAAVKQWHDWGKQLRDAGVKNVGVVVSGNEWEYPMWVMLQEEVPGVRIEHIDVKNYTKKLYGDPRFADFHPDAVFEHNRLVRVEKKKP